MMKGDGEDGVDDVQDFGSRNSGGGEGENSGKGQFLRGDQDGSSFYMGMLSRLSMNGLSMLAGGGLNGGFSLKPGLIVGTSSKLSNLGSSNGRASAVPVTGRLTELAWCGPARVVLAKATTRPARMKLVTEDNVGASSCPGGSIDGGDKGEIQQPDFPKLTTDECWRLILKLGTKWPAWNQAATPSQSTQGLVKESDSTFEGQYPSTHKEEHKEKEKSSVARQRPQDFLKLLATRALDALAQTPPPDHYGKAAECMRAPKQTTQEVMDSKAAGDAPKTPTEVTEPSPLARSVPPSSLLEVSLAPKDPSTRARTAALTIFYDGIVNVCENVPADKARLIMLFVEKAGISLNAQALLRSVKCVTPSHEGLQRSKSSPQVALLAGTSTALPSSRAHEGTLTSESEFQEPAAECSNSAISEPPPLPLTITVTAEDHSRHHVIAKPLPNARKNSLARFLDSRKRSRETTSCSEGVSPKKQALGDGCCPIDADEEMMKSPKCSQSKGGRVCDNCHNAFQRTSDAEMQDSLVE